MDAASLLAGRPMAVASDASSAAVAARDARLEPKLVAAAHSFEASLMQELLKPLDHGAEFGEDSDEDPSGLSGGLASAGEGSEGALVSFGSEALASALSEKGGLGIARRILDHFEATGAGEAHQASDGLASRAAGLGQSRKPRIEISRRN